MEDIDLSKFSKRRKSRLDELCDVSSIDVPQLNVPRRSVPDVIPLGNKKSFVDLPRRWSEPADNLAWQVETLKHFQIPGTSTIEEEPEEVPSTSGRTKRSGLNDQIKDDPFEILFEKHFGKSPLDFSKIPPIKTTKIPPALPPRPSHNQGPTEKELLDEIEEQEAIEEILLSPGLDDKKLRADRPPVIKNALFKSPGNNDMNENGNDTAEETTSCCGCFRRRRRKQKCEIESDQSNNASGQFLDFIFTCSFN